MFKHHRSVHLNGRVEEKPQGMSAKSPQSSFSIFQNLNNDKIIKLDYLQSEIKPEIKIWSPSLRLEPIPSMKILNSSSQVLDAHQLYIPLVCKISVSHYGFSYAMQRCSLTWYFSSFLAISPQKFRLLFSDLMHGVLFRYFSQL